jgi:hypothetical protein
MNWYVFNLKFDKRQTTAFEELAYLLFCAEFEQKIGVFRYKNQTGIETNPIVKDGIFYGFQAKYYTTPLSQNKADIIDSIKKAKKKYNNLNKILLYTNQELSGSSKSNKKEPKYQINIEEEAKNIDIEIIWRVPSNFEIQLSKPENKYIYDIFFGNNGLDQDFFINQIEKEIKNLGPRFNETLNFELPIAKIFNSVSKNREHYQNILTKIDEWLTKKEYRELKDNTFFEIKEESETLQQELKKWLIEFKENNLIEQKITLLPLIEKVKTLNKKIYDKLREMWKIEAENRNQNNKHLYLDDIELSKLRKIQNSNDKLIDEINDLNINLANHPILIIQGEAGCGKSHLLGDIATQRKNQYLPTILLLGTTFNNTTTIEKNILDKLDLTCKFSDFLENLNSIGCLINSRALILIDAINEGAGADLWKDQIAGFIHEVTKYPAVGLVLTIRSTYFNDIIPDNLVNSDITIITHEGFKGNEYEALKLFCQHYGLKLPNFPILNPEYANPLYLHIICETIKNLPDKSFPKGFNGVNNIYNLYKNTLNKKFGEKRTEYKYKDIVSKVIEKLAVAIFKTKEYCLDISETEKLFDIEFPKFLCLLSDLIEEGVLIKMKNEYDRNLKDIILFSYQRLGDFFIAEELLKPYNTEEEIKNAFVNDIKFKKITSKYQWPYRGIVEAFSILLPEKYNLELFELIDLFFDKSTDKRNEEWLISYTYKSFAQILLDSLKWRELKSINEKKITEWLDKYSKYMGYNEWLCTLTELAATSNHPFNSDMLHRILIRHSMSERDSFWQDYMIHYNGYDDNNIASPLQRLIDWAWSLKISYNVDAETARLVAQTLAWALSSTDITFRDKTTKALVNLLEQQPETLIKVLTAFENIDDMYILERLYAVTYGCILRTEKEDSIKMIAQYIYNAIFKNEEPPVHILIRDYARNAIEYALYKNVGLNINESLIRPPYNSKFSYKPLSNAELDKKYKPKEDSGLWGKENWGNTAILDSMTTEYGRGTSHYGDFGRYIFQANVSYFDAKNVNVDLLSNLAVEWIFEKYGYNTQLHGKYDHIIASHNSYSIHENKIERIGKKYQWIALYEILAILADNYKLEDWGNDKYSSYKGAWQLYMRNIDPAYITRNKNEKDFKQDVKKWWETEEYILWDEPDSEWIKNTDNLIDPKQVIEKKNLEGEEWLCLERFVELAEPKRIEIEQYKSRKKGFFYIIQGLLVKKSDKRRIINHLKTINFFGKWLPKNGFDYSNLINREKFWSPAYFDTYRNNKEWKTIENTRYKVIVATESAKGSIEDDKSYANSLYNIPCKYIFNGMKLQYTPIDENLKNTNGEVIVMSNNLKDVLIRKKDLIQFLEDNDLDIIWTILGEKKSFVYNRSEDSYFKALCGVYYLDDEKLNGELKMYDRG